MTTRAKLTIGTYRQDSIKGARTWRSAYRESSGRGIARGNMPQQDEEGVEGTTRGGGIPKSKVAGGV